MNRRLVSFAGSSVAIEWNGPSAAVLVEFLFRDFPSDEAASPHVTLRLLGSSTELLQVVRDDTVIYTGPADGVTAGLVMDEALFQLADRSRGGLLLHAAAVSWNGFGVVLPAPTGHGKTTLAAWLAGGEFDVLTDELVFVAEGSRRLAALPRPLRVREASWPVLAGRFGGWPPRGEVLVATQAHWVPVTALRPGNRAEAPEAAQLVFARYDPSGDGRLRAVTPAQAGLGLMACLVNARNLADHGFREAVRLARKSAAYEICYRDLDQVEAALREALAAAAPPCPP